MLQTPKFDVRPFINLALRRKWWIIVPFILSVLGGAGFLAVSPKTYKATTLILLEPQIIPDSFVKSTVTETMEGRLRTMTEQIHSRTNLEKVIRDFNLDRKTSVEATPKAMEMIYRVIPFLKREKPSQGQTHGDERSSTLRLVDQVRKNLQVTMRSSSVSKGQNVAFEISFEWPDHELVAPVTNGVAAKFMEENINTREEVAMGTTDFLDKEASSLRVEIETREKELEAFKKEHMGMLPDQLQSNINILSQLREQLQNLERRLDQEKQQIMLIKSQAQMAQIERDAIASTMRQDLGRQGRGGGTGRRETQVTTEQLTSGSFEDLERELQRLSSLYTDKHPDIVALKRRIDALRAEGKGRDADATGAARPDTSQGRLNLQLAAINANIESYKIQIKEVEKQIQIYKERVERTPQVEMALNKVLRDYQTVRQRYDGLLSKKMDAKLAEQMERRKKGEQFRVLDPAIKPPKPFKPDSMRIMAMALALGLGLGGGLAYLREVLDPRFYNPEEVEAFLGVEVLASVPMGDMKTSG